MLSKEVSYKYLKRMHKPLKPKDETFLFRLEDLLKYEAEEKKRKNFLVESRLITVQAFLRNLTETGMEPMVLALTVEVKL